jgi:Domain of unknown function (DUF1707)
MPADNLVPAPHEILASDTERERVVDALRSHAAAGRLDADELEERLERAYGARQRADLVPLTADLPVIEPPAPPRRRSMPSVAPVLAIAVLLVAIWALTGAGYFWPVWVIAWWGFALAMKSAPWLRGQPWAGSSRSTSTSNAAAIRSTASPLTRHQ